MKPMLKLSYKWRHYFKDLHGARVLIDRNFYYIIKESHFEMGVTDSKLIMNDLRESSKGDWWK